MDYKFQVISDKIEEKSPEKERRFFNGYTNFENIKKE